jgi:hypothetical protein
MSRSRIDRRIGAFYGESRRAGRFPALENSMKIIAALAIAATVTTSMIGLAQAASCRAQLGAAKAAILVDRCTEVSPATRPPCNADNPCELIISEIKRGCGLLAGGQPAAPTYCRNY